MPTGNSREPSEEVSDRDLAVRAALGDRDAFAQVVTRCGPSMFRYAVGMLDGNFEEAEDAVQEALAKAWVALPGFRGESALQTWLFRITANEVNSTRRRRRPVSVDDGLLHASPSAPAQEPEHVLAGKELVAALQRALTELPRRQREAWLLREVEHLSYGHIADILQTSETVVRGQLHRARRTLAVRMDQWR